MLHLTSSIRTGGTLSNNVEAEDNFEEQEHNLIQFVRETTLKEKNRDEENRREKTRISLLRQFRAAR